MLGRYLAIQQTDEADGRRGPAAAYRWCCADYYGAFLNSKRYAWQGGSWLSYLEKRARVPACTK